MEENRYSKSKIYKLQCDDGYYYIGSTTAPLSKRLGGHKTKSKFRLNEKKYQHINTIGWDKVKIVLVSEHCLENKEQLLREEDKHIRECREDPFCLNCRAAVIDLIDVRNKQKIYRDNNKEKNKERHKKYYEENKNIIQEKKNKRRNTKYTCNCGVIIIYSYKSRHEKTKKHIDYVNGLSSSSALSDDADLPCISPKNPILCSPHISLEKCWIW